MTNLPSNPSTQVVLFSAKMTLRSTQLRFISALVLTTLAITAHAARPFADAPNPAAVDVCKILADKGCKGVGSRAYECCDDSNLWCDTNALGNGSAGICSSCSACAAGQKQASACSALADTVCEACPNSQNVAAYADAGKTCEVATCNDGFYKNAEGVCVACSAPCDLATTGYESTACSTASDRVCTPATTVQSFAVDTLPAYDPTSTPAGQWVISPDTQGDGIVRLTSSAPASPLGTNALQLITDLTGDSARAKAFYPTGLFEGISFADFINGLNEVTFTMYKKSTGLACENQQASPSVKFEVLNAATNAYSTIVFEPYKSSAFNGAPVTKDTWLTLSAGKNSGTVSCTSGSGWWSTKLGQTKTCAPVSLLAALDAAYPALAYGDAKIVSVAVELGGNNNCVEGYVQTLRVSSNSWDFSWAFNKPN